MRNCCAAPPACGTKSDRVANAGEWLWRQKTPSWEDRAKRFLKAEFARADVGYRESAERLKKHGLKETEASIANKISRGTFSATFLPRFA
ncbi:MAG TPA: DUF6471 domain-containing protein [Xanthobacteraceae bacterium]|nr:DUF6471 domain-containing protein [Xanthobacteraceae bacterium]